MNPELKAALEATQKAQADLKLALEAKDKEVSRLGIELGETKGKIDAMVTACNEKLEAAQKQWDEVNAKVNRAEISAPRTGEQLAEEAVEFDRSVRTELAALGKSHLYRPISQDAYKAYKPAFLAFMKHGAHAIDRGGADFSARLSVGSDPDGGLFVPPDILAGIVKIERETSPLMRLADVRPTGRDRVLVRHRTGVPTSRFAGEGASGGETGTPRYGEHEVPVHKLEAEPWITQEDLDDPEVNMEQLLMEELAEEMGITITNRFVVGESAKSPRGFLKHSAGTPTHADFKKVQQVNTGVSANFAASPNGPDIFVDLEGALKVRYRRNARWALNRSVLAKARKLKDSNGQYQVVKTGQDEDGRPVAMINEYPADLFEDMPDLAANSLSLALADWKQAYIIPIRMGMTILRDPLTAKGYVKFYSTQRIGGDVKNFEAIKIAKFI